MVALKSLPLLAIVLYLGSASAAVVQTSSTKALSSISSSKAASSTSSVKTTTTASTSSTKPSSSSSSIKTTATSSLKSTSTSASSSKSTVASSSSKAVSSSSASKTSTTSSSTKATTTSTSSIRTSTTLSTSKASSSSSSSKSTTSSSASKSTSTLSTAKTTATTSSSKASSTSSAKASTTTVKASTSVTNSSAIASASSSANSTSTGKLGLTSTFIYDLDNTPIAAPIIKTKSGLSLNEGVYIVDMAGSTAAQIANYHAQGKKVGCYFSAGTWEPYRADALSFLPQCYCGPNVTTDATGRCTGTGSTNNLLGEWGEWYLDIHSETCLWDNMNIMTSRIEAAAAKGCDYIDPDNVDSYANTQNFGNTAQDEVNYLLWLSETAKANGMGIDLKNAGDLITDPDTGAATQWTSSLVNAFDFNVIESCHQYNECDKYDPFLTAGKPQIQIEYSNSITKCPTLATGQKLLVYSGTVVDSNAITLSCQ